MARIRCAPERALVRSRSGAASAGRSSSIICSAISTAANGPCTSWLTWPAKAARVSLDRRSSFVPSARSASASRTASWFRRLSRMSITAAASCSRTSNASGVISRESGS